MQYLRMLTNAVIGGAFLGAHVALLVLQLNPAVRLDSLDAARLVLAWWAFYGIHASVFFYALIVIQQLFADEVRPPGWTSLRLLSVFATIGVSLAAFVTWMNVRGFSPVLSPDVSRRMISAAAVLSACAATCAALTLVQLRLRRGRGAASAMLVLAAIASLAVPLWLRGEGSPLPGKIGAATPPISPIPSTARVSMILLDGASLDFIAPAAAGGRVPNFGRLLENGAVVHLATLRPTQPAPVWTAVATGKLPYKTGVHSAARYRVSGSSQRLDLLPDFCFAQALFRFGLLSTETTSSDAVRARPVWELVSAFGITAGVIGWPVTYPAHGVNGYVVSDEFLRRDDSPALASLRDEPPLASPPDVLDLAREARLRAAANSGPMDVAPRRAVPAPPAGENAPANPVAVDAAVEQIAGELSGSHPVQLTAVRYPGLDAVGHYYLRYAVPRAFGDVSDDERRRFGGVLEQYYMYVDGIVGSAMAALGPDDLLLVVSGFGMEPLSLEKRVLERLAGDPELSGSHEGAPDGFLMAYGRSVAKGVFPRASVVDVAPTVLYFLGLPVARDMDGYARTDIFAPAFTERKPITFIPYYDR